MDANKNLIAFPGMLPENARSQYDALATSPEGKSYDCPNCGFMPAKELRLGGKTRYVRQECPCQKKAREAREKAEREAEQMTYYAKRTYSWLGDRWSDIELLEKTLYTFDDSIQREAFDTVKMFMEIFKGSLVLHGTFGTGKTHLLAALCNQMLREKKTPSLFTTAPKLFATIQHRIQCNEDYSQIISHAMKAPLLVIDDVDKAKHTDFREEIYFEIVDERVKAGKPIAISTNRLSDLANYVGGAVCSRLKVGQIAVEMIGVDYREGLDA